MIVEPQSFESMLFRREGAIAEIVLNRPDRRNATDLVFYQDLLACLDLAEADEAVRVIVLRAEGPSFCAGQNLKFTGSATPTEIREYRKRMQESWDRIMRHPRPVIARVQGDALGGGTYIVSRCDLVVARRHARFAMREIAAGEQSGGALLLMLGKQRALEMSLLGRYLTAEEAERWGLINRCVDSDEEMDAQIAAWTEQLLTLPPLGIRQTKLAAAHALDRAGLHLLQQADFGGTLRQTEDWLEAKRAFQERRKPDFKGR
jgi:enoyl-CoA hydratase/carnithine racemase